MKNKVKKRQPEDIIDNIAIQADILIKALTQTAEIYNTDIIKAYLLSKEEYDIKLSQALYNKDKINTIRPLF